MITSGPQELRGDNVQGFNTKWGEVLLSMKQNPEDGILEIMQEETPGFRMIEVCILETQCKKEKSPAMFE